MNSKKVIAVACALAGASRVFAGTITFDDAPITGTDLGSYYAGVTFGPGAQVAAQITPTYPAHSGNQILIASDIGNPTIAAVFSQPQAQVSFWFTVADFSMTATAFDSMGHAVSSFTGGPNGGSTAEATLFGSGADIASVEITDNGGLGDFMAIDDFSAPNISGLPAPDATSTLALLGFAGAGLVALRRKFSTR